MKIVLVGNLPEDGQQSMQRFTSLLETGLRARGHEVTVLAPSLRAARLGPTYHYNGLPKYLGYFDKFVLFPKQLRQDLRRIKPDVVHFTDHANAPYFSATRSIPTVATCHDLMQIRAAAGEIAAQTVGRAASLHQNWIRRSLGRLPHVACVSTETQVDVLRLTGLPAEKVSTIPNALNYPYKMIAPTEAWGRFEKLAARFFLDLSQFAPTGPGFILQVGGEQWYKNRPGLLAIYARVTRLLPTRPKLIMVGPPLSAELIADAKALDVLQDIIVISGVSNSELEALYNLAKALLFPSLEEGFGWPIAEAQACGCPVFTTNRGPMNEVGGRSSVYFDPSDYESAARIIFDAWETKKERIELALREARRWMPESMLSSYETLYQRLVA